MSSKRYSPWNETERLCMFSIILWLLLQSSDYKILILLFILKMQKYKIPMIKKGSKLYSIFKGVCPKCHGESMYIEKNPYVLSQVLKMHEKCSLCNTKYRIEPSFFFGSMYVSYGVGIAFAVAAFVISFLFFGSTLLTAFIAIVITLVAFGPIIMRWSRNIWINMFMDFDASKVKEL